MTEPLPKETFSSHEEAVRHAMQSLRLRLNLPQDMLPDDSMKALVASAEVVHKVPVAPPTFPETASPAMIRSFRYVIRDDDLYTLSNFLDLVKAAGALAVGMASLPTLAGFKAIGDAAHAFYGTFKSILARGERLTPAEFLILVALKEARTASAGEIAKTLSGGQLAIDAGTVETFLARHERRDNKGFTRRVSPNAWCLDGI